MGRNGGTVDQALRPHMGVMGIDVVSSYGHLDCRHEIKHRVCKLDHVIVLRRGWNRGAADNIAMAPAVLASAMEQYVSPLECDGMPIENVYSWLLHAAAGPTTTLHIGNVWTRMNELSGGLTAYSGMKGMWENEPGYCGILQCGRRILQQAPARTIELIGFVSAPTPLVEVAGFISTKSQQLLLSSTRVGRITSA